MSCESPCVRLFMCNVCESASVKMFVGVGVRVLVLGLQYVDAMSAFVVQHMHKQV